MATHIDTNTWKMNQKTSYLINDSPKIIEQGTRQIADDIVFNIRILVYFMMLYPYSASGCVIPVNYAL